MPYYNDGDTAVYNSADDADYQAALRMAQESQAAFGAMGDKSPQVQQGRSRGAALPNLNAAPALAPSPAQGGATYNAYGNVPQSLPELSQDIEDKKLAHQLAVATVQQKIDNINDVRSGLPPRGSGDGSGGANGAGLDPTQGGTIPKYVGSNGEQNTVSVADSNAPTIDTSAVSQEMINPRYAASQATAEQAREDRLTGFNRGAQAATIRATQKAASDELSAQTKALQQAAIDPNKHADTLVRSQKRIDDLNSTLTDQLNAYNNIEDTPENKPQRDYYSHKITDSTNALRDTQKIADVLKKNAGIDTNKDAPAGITKEIQNHGSVTRNGDNVIVKFPGKKPVPGTIKEFESKFGAWNSF